MSNNTAFGLKSIQMGAMSSTGGMGTVLTTILATAADTASFESTPPSVNEVVIEESDFPWVILNTKPPQFSVKWTTYDVDPVLLQSALGGTYTAKNGSVLATLTAATIFPSVELSLVVTSLTGHVLSVVRAKIMTTVKWNFAKGKPAQVDFMANILLPTDGVSTPYIMTYPA